MIVPDLFSIFSGAVHLWKKESRVSYWIFRRFFGSGLTIKKAEGFGSVKNFEILRSVQYVISKNEIRFKFFR